MIDGIYSCRFYIGKRVWRSLNGPINVSDQCRIRSDVNQTAEDAQVGLPFGIDGTNQADRFKTGKTVDKIGAIKSLPGLNGGGRNEWHSTLMQLDKNC